MGSRMRKIYAATLLVLCQLFVGAYADEPLRLAPLPLENREAVALQFDPMVQHLARELGRPVELIWSGYHDEVLNAFIDGDIDIAFLGPLPYLHLRQRHSAVTPIIRFVGSDGQSMYRCALVRFGDDIPPVEHPHKLRVGLTQPLSTCGFLGTDSILRSQYPFSLEQTRYRYLGSHEEVALAVIAGEAELGGVKDEFADKFANLGLEVAGWSERVPGVALFANRNTLDEATIAAIRQVLLATPEMIYQHWGSTIRHGMIDAQESDFDALHEFGDINAIPLLRDEHDG